MTENANAYNTASSVLNFPPKDDLSSQLVMFRRKYEFDNALAAQKIMKSMCSEVRLLFSQVEQLIRLMLVCRVTSYSAERPFSVA